MPNSEARKAMNAKHSRNARRRRGVPERVLPEMLGMTFGRLTVVALAEPDAGGCRQWRCVCACGTEVIRRGYSMRRGDTQSCGCLRLDHPGSARTAYSTAEEAGWHFLFYQLKRSALERGLACTLDFETAKAIRLKPCHYCGAEPELRKGQKSRSDVVASGIDRVDNSRGYVEGNVVPCCTWCNRAKLTHTQEDFVQHCIRVAEHCAGIARRNG